MTTQKTLFGTTMPKRRGAILLTGILEDEWFGEYQWFSPYNMEQLRNIAELGGIYSSFDPRLRDITLAARKYRYGKITAELMGVNDCAWVLFDKIHRLSPAARNRLYRDGINLGELSKQIVALTDNTPDVKLLGRGRRPLKARKAFLDNVGHAWVTITGQDPGISRIGARRSGPFFRFLRACVEPFPELADSSLKDGTLERAFRDAYQE